jgi:hypothetical protein
MPDRTDAGGPSAWVRIDLDEAAQGADVHITLEQRLRAAMARQ